MTVARKTSMGFQNSVVLVSKFLDILLSSHRPSKSKESYHGLHQFLSKKLTPVLISIIPLQLCEFQNVKSANNQVIFAIPTAVVACVHT